MTPALRGMVRETRLAPVTCFIAACSSANFDDCGTVVERVVGNEGGLDPALEVGDRGIEAHFFLACHGGHLRVVERSELAHLRELVLQLLQTGGACHQSGQPLMFTPQLGQPLGIPQNRGIEQVALDVSRAL